MESKTAVLLVNLGTPDSPRVPDVRSYLSQFLNDPRVIDIPWLLRKILVNLIIVPFRAPKSAKLYQELWTENGSPLLYYSNQVKELLQKELSADHTVYLAMRYKNPSIPDVLEEIKKENYKRITIVPLFPQYASASTGSALEEIFRHIKTWWVIPELKIISQYHDHPAFIDAIVARSEHFRLSEYDHILFSYHGLPVRQVEKAHPCGACTGACDVLTNENQYCYKATCFATTQLIASRLEIPKERYTVCFQSRLDKEWLTPFSDEVVKECAQKGMKKLLVFSPAFTADCLETIIEIGEEYQEIFEENGGEKVQLVPSLNDHPRWVDCLKELVLSN